MASIREKLEQAGIKITPQRLAVGEVLFDRHQHLTADEVYDRLRYRRSGVSRATVYNTLNLFTEKGLLREIFVDANCAFYDTNLKPHYHLYNVDTGELMDVEDDRLLDRFSRDLPDGTRLEGVDVVVRVGCRH